MMDRTDRHFRFFMRQITKRTLLYTEMVVAQTILYANKEGRLERYLGFHPEETPLAVQLGGSSPNDLAKASQICESRGYTEINLNVGCPSDRVQNGKFGACLMKSPSLVADCLSAMREAVDIPVTIKHRIGVDDLDRREDLHNFVETLCKTGVRHFIVHARKAWLQGLSPHENRTRPPLRYEDVYKLKEEFPELCIEINGGITQPDEISNHLKQVDGVMIGRAAYDNPWLFHDADTQFLGALLNPSSSRAAVVEKILHYCLDLKNQGFDFRPIIRRCLGLFHGVAGVKKWRQFLDDHLKQNMGDPQFLSDSLRVFSTPIECSG
jgi:tRNA-dihydrouridine synthase A